MFRQFRNESLIEETNLLNDAEKSGRGGGDESRITQVLPRESV